MNRPCFDVHLHPDKTQDSCRLCWLWLYDKRYTRLWSDTPDARCKHLGEETGEFRECKTCNQTLILLPIYSCSRHGKCLLERPQADMMDCKSCDDYERRE